MHRRTARLALTAVALSTLTALAACSSSTTPAASSSPATSTGSSGASSSASLSGSITVSAASSLTGTFNQLKSAFQAAHPGTTVTINYGSSGDLATQITQGAPVDVFASAAPKNMDSVVAAGDASNPTTFAKNTLEIAVPPANPAGVTQLSDLARSNVKTVLCVLTAPCGATAATMFTNAKLTVNPVTRAKDVKTTLTTVENGEADAGIVYVTDVKAAGDKVKGIEIPAGTNVSTSYPIAVLKGTRNAALAQAWVAYVTSSAGQSVLTAAGFQSA